MALENFNDLSEHTSGYQFEFYCKHCERRWKSAFQPNRVGQFTRLLSNAAEFFNGARKASHVGYKLQKIRGDGPHRVALADAQRDAAKFFVVCGACDSAVCNDCFRENEQVCDPCLRSTPACGAIGQARAAPPAAGPACPSCSTPSGGGRFCAECGFDMASTHKSCPGCAAMCERATRFCADCGHGF